MARQLRIEIAGGLYHIMSRGNAKAPIFLDDADRIKFIDRLATTVDTFRWRCYAYCLMSNHYHLLIETPEANLSAGVHLLNGTYTQSFNRKWSRTGHVFQGRFKSIIVEKESYLLELSRYIVLNPVRSGIVRSPEDYQWSSYKANAGLIPAPGFLFTQWIADFFNGANSSESVRAYVEFVKSPEEPPEAIREKRGIVLGGSKFIEQLRPLMQNVQASGEFPREQRLLARPSLFEIFGTESLTRKDRNNRIYQAIMEYGYSPVEVASFTGLHYSSISRIKIQCTEMSKYKT